MEKLKTRSWVFSQLSGRWLLLLLSSAFLLFFPAEGDDLYYDFVLKNANFTRLCETKSMLVVNESFPGPIIYLRKGDTVYVNVHNQGDYGVTIHWHGVKQPRNPWFDGPEYITQCPIAAGTNFTYQIIFSSEVGTLWWHAHSDWTRATVHGAIVIRPAVGTTYAFPEPDAEQVIVFESWYKKDVMELMETALEEGGLTTLSSAYCINGQPGDFYPCSSDTTFRMVVEYGKTYLLRIVNAAQNQDFFFAIANHTLTVVGVDAAYVKPLPVSVLMIAPGETMDVLVVANQTIGQYYMIASPYFDGQAADYDNSTTSAIFEYAGSFTNASVIPADQDTITPDYDDIGEALYFVSRLRSLANAEYPVEVPTEINTRMFVVVSMNLETCINASCDGPNGDRLAAALNNMSFANPTVDVLQAYYRNLSGYYKPDFPDFPSHLFNFTTDDSAVTGSDNYTLSQLSTKVKVLEYNETVEIVFQGTDILNSGENHPLHLHGYRFFVVGSGTGNFDNVTDPLSYNLHDPPEVNTFPIPKDGWAAIRFKASNPGVWFFHCHFDKHLSWGMATAFIVKDGGTPETSMLPPPDNMPSCSASYKDIISLRESLTKQQG